jgi:hypothetical protein
MKVKESPAKLTQKDNPINLSNDQNESNDKQKENVQVEDKDGKLYSSNKPGLKMYRSTYFHFEFDYPEKWGFSDESNGINYDGKKNLHYMMLFDQPYYEGGSIMEIYPEGGWNENKDSQTKVTKSEIYIGGYKATKTEIREENLVIVRLNGDLPQHWNTNNIILFKTLREKVGVFDNTLKSFRFF